MTHNAERGLHACVGCGLELDADDRDTRCEECADDCATCGRDNRNGTHDALERFGHLRHSFTTVIPPGSTATEAEGGTP